MKDLIAKWKYRGDYKMAEVFIDGFESAFKKQFSFLKNPVMIPIPLSGERMEERAFNQAKQLAQFLPGETVEVLSRKHSEKQSKKSRVERMSSDNPFLAKGPIYKPAILVDDIYTTGSTLHHAAERLKEKGCPAVYGFTLIRG
jgi:competence protein ComFC